MATTVLVISVAAVVVVVAVVSDDADDVELSDGDCSRGAGSIGVDDGGSYDV